MALKTISFIIISIVLIFNSCNTSVDTPELEDYKIASLWSDMSLYILQYTPANSPTFASRSIGYIGLTMYESVVPGYEDYQSLVTQLNGLEDLPIPDENNEYDWRLSFNAAQASILKGIYQQTSDENKQRIDSLEHAILKNLATYIKDKDLINRSVEFGRTVANAIYQWSLDDGGHRAYLKNFDKDFVHPEFAGSWKPPLYAQSFSHHPLHPYWGNNRSFLKENSDLDLPYMIPYDTSKTSAYYQQFMTVYQKDLELTQEEKEIAIWWGDDPDDTFTPPGHSFYIAGLLVNNFKPSLIKCAETYARVGLAVADAFINCWKWKYHFFSERANTFIPTYIDQQWESFWPDPPFPAFPSGHAIQAAAAATALIDIYGNEVSFVDKSHANRERDEIRDVDFKERTFNTIWDIAVETANSRFYGGIHIPLDNEVGLKEGARIANNVNKLKWKK